MHFSDTAPGKPTSTGAAMPISGITPDTAVPAFTIPISARTRETATEAKILSLAILPGTTTTVAITTAISVPKRVTKTLPQAVTRFSDLEPEDLTRLAAAIRSLVILQAVPTPPPLKTPFSDFRAEC